jgi:hypothetical protein
MWLLTLQLFKNSIDTQEKLRLNLHSLSVSKLLEYRRMPLIMRPEQGLKLPDARSPIDDSSFRRNFDLDKKNETITIAGKSI